jgi:hypothetical protein
MISLLKLHKKELADLNTAFEESEKKAFAKEKLDFENL